MTLRQLISLLGKNLKFLLIGAVGVAALIFVLTRNEEKVYESKTEIYTGIASGISLDNVEQAKSDFFSINSEFDNMTNVIKSRQTLEDVGIKLLAEEALGWSKGMYLDLEYAEWVPEEVWSEWVIDTNLASIEEKISKFRVQEHGSALHKQLFSVEWSPFSAQAIQAVKVNRLNNSDFLEIQYQWSSPRIAQRTLEILNEVFLDRMATIKKRQANNVVEYFRQQTEVAMNRLKDSEERLKDFRIDNNIINYTEQTKQLAVMKERLEDERQKEVATYEASKAAVEELESKLANHREITRFSDDLLRKRQELTDINTQIALLEVYYRDQDEVEQLRKRSEELREELSDILSTRYDLGKSTEGLPVAQLLDEWLMATLSVDRSEARLEVFRERMIYFQAQYEEFAPLGSQLGRMEREIGVHEKNYLELLHSYNLALMRLENEEVSSGGAVVTVPPNYALDPLPTKRKLLIIIGFVVGALIPLSVLILRAFLDRALRTAKFAESKIGIRVIGGFPSEHETEKKKIDGEFALQRAAVMVAQNFLPRAVDDHKVVTFFATSEHDSLSGVVLQIRDYLKEHGLAVATVGYTAEFDQQISSSDMLDAARIESTIIEAKKDASLVLVLLPPLLNQPYSPQSLAQSDQFVLLADASREWYNSDALSLKELMEKTEKVPGAVLYNMRIEDVESLIGEVPQRYNWFIRKLLKYSPK
ncbi:MAG: hypothetical protein HWE14_02375 [Flavobacteriia bacterium]|nr:hypothetical protein [Flavobacteriia bacterium]